jgi:hypothetical protein
MLGVCFKLNNALVYGQFVTPALRIARRIARPRFHAACGTPGNRH